MLPSVLILDRGSGEIFLIFFKRWFPRLQFSCFFLSMQKILYLYFISFPFLWRTAKRADFDMIFLRDIGVEKLGTPAVSRVEAIHLAIVLGRAPQNVVLMSHEHLL